MNNRSPGAPNPAGDQSALSLLVRAAEGRDSTALREASTGGLAGSAGAGGGGNLAETLRLRGLSGMDPSLEEQLMLQQQAQSLLAGGGGGAGGAGGSSALLSQLRDQGLLSQLGGSLGGAGGGQNQQLAALLGLGGAHNAGNDVRAALAAQLRQSQQQQLQQQQQQHQPPQLSHADLLALSRSGALSSGGMAGLLSRIGGGAGGLSGFGGSGLASELENLQRLEELERRQRLMTSAIGGSPSLTAAAPGQAAMDSSAGIREAALRDERMNATHIPRPPGQEIGGGPKPKASVPGEHGAAPMPSETNKDELEKTPGSVIVPCRARGMPMDHNFKTAYFVIPENVKHGEELICSYFACRNAGIKFRYCSHCKVPVAKRNFRKRHKHGGEEIPRGAGEESGGEEEPAVKKGIPAHIMAGKSDGAEADALSSQSADSNPQEKSDLGVRQGLVQSSMRTLEAKKPEVSQSQDSEADVKISFERKERWAALLGKRPATKDGDSMSAWLMEVLAVSDLDTPLKSEDGQLMLPDMGMAVAAFTDGKAEDAKEAAVATDSPFTGGIVKKKRPAPEAAKTEAGNSSGPEQLTTGSFAEWKERKKAKKQAKLNPASEAEV